MTEQIIYMGRAVPRKSFVAFVYKGDERILASSYDEFRDYIDNKGWLDQPVQTQPKKKRPKRPA